MFYRELGFGLEGINEILRDPEYDRADALRQQRDLLVVRKDRLQAMIGAVQTALDAHEKGITMTKEEMFEVFGDFDPKAHEAEVEERWAGPALEQSKRRTRKYGKDQWKEAMAQGESITAELAERLRAGDAPDDAAAMDLAEQHRLHIDRWFYECSHEMHTGLGNMYVADPRFTEVLREICSRSGRVRECGHQSEPRATRRVTAGLFCQRDTQFPYLGRSRRSTLHNGLPGGPRDGAVTTTFRIF